MQKRTETVNSFVVLFITHYIIADKRLEAPYYLVFSV